MELICIISVMQVNKRLTEVELEIKIIDLRRWYMPIDLNPAHHNNKLKSMRKLLAILEQSDRRNFQKLTKIDDIILCALTLIYYFGMRLRLNKSTSSYFTRWCSKRHFLKAETVFQKTLYRLLPERSEATTTIMLAFFASVSIWPFENFVANILKIILNFTRKQTIVFHMVLGDAEFLHDLPSARHRLSVLYELLDCDHIIFKQWNLLLPFINRLLDYYAREVDEGSKKLINYYYLKNGFEICLYRIFEKVHNQHRLTILTTLLDWCRSLDIEDDDILGLYGLLHHTAALYKVGSFSESLPNELVDPILKKLIASTNPLLSLVGCRLILQLIDRHRNAPQVVEPKLYYEITKTQLKVGTCENIDKLFIKHHRHKLYAYLMIGVKSHCEHVANLKAMFSVMCCIILEVPCGLTAGAVACTMMLMQDYALKGEDISSRSRYWMHAIVISVMSLICWVHKAPVLRTYVNQIIKRRASEAPHLNPPLLQEYHEKGLNPWTRKSLFFQDWEMRYGLWKAFEISPVWKEL